MKSRRGTLSLFAFYTTIIVGFAVIILGIRFAPFFLGLNGEDSFINFVLNNVFIVAGLAVVFSLFIYWAVAQAN